MLKLSFVKPFYVAILIVILISSNVFAINAPILISQLKLGDELSAKNEYVKIYNNTDQDIEITDWCLFYQSITLVDRKLNCFTSTSEFHHLFLPSNQSSILISNEQFISNPLFEGDAFFSATFSGTGGYIYLVDNSEAEIDEVGWNNNISIGNFASIPGPGEIISRKQMIDSNLLQDTDNNFDDFEVIISPESHSFGEIYEIFDICHNVVGIQSILPENYYVNDSYDCYEIVDLCGNIDGLQLFVPEGYEIDEDNDCQPDLCPNIDNLQLTIPEDMILQDGQCVYYDYCPNIDDIQMLLPAEYYLNKDGDCLFDFAKLQLNELLPNVDGVDDGNEFIEIYNPNDFEIDLSNYIFKLDSESEKYHLFSRDSKINANSYFVIYNSDPEFSLKNTSGGVWLYTIDNQFVDKVTYEDPDEDESWALLDGVWQYTNRVTVGLENLAYFKEEIVAVKEEELAPCGPNQYRNPETNRCKNIVVAVSTLVPCKDGQYRSEETNRCRNIVTDVVSLMPCDEGEERNPETNRCRKITTTSILGDSSLQPCPEGEERNSETNRCRKIVKEIPEVDYEIEPINQNTNNNVIWLSIGAVGFVALIYAIWEWRQEIRRSFDKLINFVSRKK